MLLKQEPEEENMMTHRLIEAWMEGKGGKGQTRGQKALTLPGSVEGKIFTYGTIVEIFMLMKLISK